MSPRRWIILFAVALLACKSEEYRPESRQQQNLPTSAQVPSAASPPRAFPAPPSGEATDIIRTQAKRSSADGRPLVVYVGAVWCEPCRAFHDALKRGELDRALAGVDLLEFDLDRDRDRLVAAGYQSRLIPLFARPADDGRASGRQIEGSIKGPGAPAEIVPRLRALLQ